MFTICKENSSDMGLILCSINICCFLVFQSFLAHGNVIGLNYGLLGDNIPPPDQVISLVKSRNITRIRLFGPNLDVLEALQNAGIEVILGTLNGDLQNLASSDISFAKTWVQTNIVPYAQTITFRCIAVGSEANPSDLSAFVLSAMKNINAALQAFNLGQIPVSTSIGIYLLASSSPPSKAEFSWDVKPALQQISGFLSENRFPFLVTVYPYFSYIYDPSVVPLSFVLFNSTDIVVRDGNLGYSNIFDAMIDALYWALENVGTTSIDVVVSETGWPTKGNGNFTTIDLAQTYNQNLVNHVSSSGTPKQPDKKIETYVFALFNEDLKPAGVEQNFGLFYPDMSEVYHVDFK